MPRRMVLGHFEEDIEEEPTGHNIKGISNKIIHFPNSIRVRDLPFNY